MAKEKKKSLGLWIALGIIGFVILLMVGSLVFVEVSINNLSTSLEQKQTEVIAAYEARSKTLEKLTGMIESKMKLNSDVFTRLERAEAALEKAEDVKALSDANLEVDSAIDNLIFVMRDKYYYLETPEVWEIEDEIDSARSRIVLKTTDYNDVAKDYNFAIENFPGDFLSSIFGHEGTETFQIVDYDDITF